LAGKSTLNRLELTPVRANARSRYKKIVARTDAMQASFLEAFLLQHQRLPDRLVLDVDATDFPLHGQQLGRFFHGYYDCYCYLPLYIFCNDHPLLALLRPSNIDGSVGLLKHLIRIVTRLRRVRPDISIVVRGDSGFCRDHLMTWCESNGVDYLFGLAKNPRLQKQLLTEMEQAEQQYRRTGQAARVFKEFLYRTLDSWSRERRVVGKAEYLSGGPNPRFVVTSLPAEQVPMQLLYEEHYCGRGDMENRIKEQQLMLFADRVSCSTMRANQVRLCLSTMAYILLRALRQFGLGEEEPVEALSVATALPTVLETQVVVSTPSEPVGDGAGEQAAALPTQVVPPSNALTPPVAETPGASPLAGPELPLQQTAAPQPQRPPLQPQPAVPIEVLSPELTAFLLVAALPTTTSATGEIAAPPAPAAGLLNGVTPPEGDRVLNRRAEPQAQCDTLRLRLLKIGALVQVSTRRVYISLSESYAFRDWFLRAWDRLRQLQVPVASRGVS
jgi:hypothetical protein